MSRQIQEVQVNVVGGKILRLEAVCEGTNKVWGGPLYEVLSKLSLSDGIGSDDTCIFLLISSYTPSLILVRPMYQVSTIDCVLAHHNIKVISNMPKPTPCCNLYVLYLTHRVCTRAQGARALWTQAWLKLESQYRWMRGCAILGMNLVEKYT